MPTHPTHVRAHPAGPQSAQYISLDVVTEGATFMAMLSSEQARSLGRDLLPYVPSDALRKEAATRGLQVTEPEWEILANLASSAIDKVAYRERDQTLVLQFVGRGRGVSYVAGLVMRYVQVPRAIFDGFKSALSAGSHYNEYVKGHFPSLRISEFPGA